MFLLFKICFLTFFVGISTDQDTIKNDEMMGVDTVHDIKIDKDTVISRNMNLEKSNRKHPYSESNDRKTPAWTYSSFPKEVQEHVNQFKRNMSECLKEVQANDKRPIKRLSPKTDSPVHGECLIACVLKRNGVIHNGKIYKDNLISLVEKFYKKDEKFMKKLEKNLDRCIQISARGKNDCAIAGLLNECTNDLMANNKHKVVVNY